jgi:predicted nucleic acid-binding protein
MSWVDSLYGTVVGLDTAPLIYYVEAHPRYLPILSPFFKAVDRGDIHLVTSTLTLAEVLVHPLRHNNPILERQYSSMLLNTRGIETCPVSPAIAREAARLRALYGFKTPDAVQLATAITEKATAFLTNDGKLLAVRGLQTIVLDLLP